LRQHKRRSFEGFLSPGTAGTPLHGDTTGPISGCHYRPWWRGVRALGGLGLALGCFLGVKGLGGVDSIFFSAASRRRTVSFSLSSSVMEAHSTMSQEGEKPSRIIDLGQVAQIAGQDEIWALRGKAIGAYSNLEQSLSHLFGKLLRAPMDRASVVFFKITSTQTRNAIFDKLLRKEHGQQFSLFWNAYLKQMRDIDTRRNEIVHWAVANKIDAGDGPPKITMALMPPAFWDHSPQAPELLAQDLVAFIVKCDVYARLCNMFNIVTDQQVGTMMTPEQRQSWLDIFQLPLVYPLPTGHPLNAPQQAPGSPPQSSQGSAPVEG
jgi:hypothetical protein